MRKNYWKKLLVSMTLVASMLIGVAGCGGDTTSDDAAPTQGATSGETTNDKKDDTAKEPVKVDPVNVFGDYYVTTDNITLTYWHYEDQGMADRMCEAFMDMYPNITVENKVISDMSTDLSAAAAAGTFPDVFEGTDSDTALANMYWADITEYWNADPENKNLMPTIDEYGIGMFDTSVRFAAPMRYWPSAVFIDRNVIETLNLEMPRTDWTWEEMIQLIKTLLSTILICSTSDLVTTTDLTPYTESLLYPRMLDRLRVSSVSTVKISTYLTGQSVSSNSLTSSLQVM